MKMKVIINIMSCRNGGSLVRQMYGQSSAKGAASPSLRLREMCGASGRWLSGGVISAS
jgi:hypothetical protein